MPEDNYEDEESQGSVFQTMPKEQFIFILIALLLWLVFRWNQAIVSGGQLDIALAAVLILNLFIRIGNDAWKYHSPQIVSENLHASTFGWHRGVPIGMWMIFRMGDRVGIEYKGSDGTIIVNKACVTRRGRNVDINARLEKVTEDELPSQVVNEVISNRYPEPYYVGYWPEKQLRLVPKISLLIGMFREESRTVNMLRQASGIREGEMESTAMFYKRQLDRMSRSPSLMERIRRRKEEEW